MRNMRAIHALVCLCIATAKEQRYDPQQLIAMLSVQPSHTQRLIHKASFGLWGEQQNASLWSLQCDSRKYGTRKFLFMAEPHRTHLECGQYESGEALAVNGILENKDDTRDDTLSRWCLRADGTGDSRWTRRTIRFRQISPAPTLRELAAKSTGSQCRPRSVRYSGFFKSARELLCFAQGYRPAAVLQRLVHDRDTLYGTINDKVTKIVASPYERAILTWLTARDVVWVGTSRIEYERDPRKNDLNFQESVVLARDAQLGRDLVSERVQDITVPFAGEPEKRIDHCAYAGRLLGYPVSEIYDYLMYDLDRGVQGATRERVSQAIDSAHRKIKAAAGPRYADFEVGSHQLPPIDGVDELLYMQLDGSSLIEAAEFASDTARCLCDEHGASPEQIREAVALLESTLRTSQRVFGRAHPNTKRLEGDLAIARLMLPRP